MTMLTNEILVAQPEFQRRLVWTNRHKQLFIETVLDGMPFPEIFFCDGSVDLNTGAGTTLLVDGQQRVTTLYQYFTGSDQFKPGDIRPYVDLEPEEKAAFLNYDVVVRDLGSLSMEQVREVFRRMNSTNYSLNAMEVNNARFDGALKKAAEGMSGCKVFEDHRVFTAVDIRRMGDVRWCLDVIITVMSGYFSRSDSHEEYLERYNDEFPEGDEVEAKLNDCLVLLSGLNLDSKSRAWQKNDLFTLAVEIYQLGAKNLRDSDGLAAALKEFFADVETVTSGGSPEKYPKAIQYRDDVISGTNERARRVRRGEVIRNIISPFFAGS
ncbi:DUF262 domain-containing protein [Streptomyces sp. NBC_01136]|uniref:DUF262 domain-containing protein n=1 Tax=Streptomyces sp. NBC_01136 TaxID=2903754 RepID=UPI00386F7C51|nr:DUF262 domain-containing protein [Streptomyces sp. NBC_01136]